MHKSREHAASLVVAWTIVSGACVGVVAVSVSIVHHPHCFPCFSFDRLNTVCQIPTRQDGMERMLPTIQQDAGHEFVVKVIVVLKEPDMMRRKHHVFPLQNHQLILR